MRQEVTARSGCEELISLICVDVPFSIASINLADSTEIFDQQFLSSTASAGKYQYESGCILFVLRGSF